jgi:taurine transport system permease protein
VVLGGIAVSFPPSISPRKRLVYGSLGVLTVLAVWWLLTLPLFTELRPRRDFAKTSVFARVHDPVTGEPLEVEKPDYDVVVEEVRSALVNPPALDTPVKTLRDAWRLLTAAGPEPNLLEHILWSSLRILLGFLISSAVAVPLGISMGLFPRLRAMVNPIISFLRPLPSIAWVPLAIIWLGAGEAQKLAIIFMGSFSAALIYTIEATVKIDPDLIRAAQNLGVGRGQLLWRVLLPAALPSILSGLKVVMAIGWTCVISAEIVATRAGLGSLIWNAKELNATSVVLVGMVCISGVVLVLDALFVKIERRLLPWVFVDRAEAAAEVVEE